MMAKRTREVWSSCQICLEFPSLISCILWKLGHKNSIREQYKLPVHYKVERQGNLVDITRLVGTVIFML